MLYTLFVEFKTHEFFRFLAIKTLNVVVQIVCRIFFLIVVCLLVKATLMKQTMLSSTNTTNTTTREEA